METEKIKLKDCLIKPHKGYDKLKIDLNNQAVSIMTLYHILDSLKNNKSIRKNKIVKIVANFENGLCRLHERKGNK